MRLPLIAVTSLLCVTSALAADYKILKTIPLPGDGGWDYLYADADSRRLFIARGSHVMVFDMDQEKMAGDIPDTPGVHGVAISTATGKGFISSGRANRVDMFNAKTLAKTGAADVGANPDAILYDPSSKRVFAFNGRSKDATVVGEGSEKVEGTIPLGGKPETGVSDGAGHVFVNIEDTGEIADIDAAAMKVKRRFKVEGCEEPSGLAIDTAHKRLYAGCGNKVMAVVDARSGKTLAKVPIGEGVDACGFDPGTGLAFASTGDGHLTMIKETSPGKFDVVQTLETQRGARTMTVDTKTHRVYTVSASFGPAPAATAANPHPWPSMKPGTFVLLVAGQD